MADGTIEMEKVVQRIRGLFPPPNESAVSNSVTKLPNGHQSRLSIKNERRSENSYKIFMHPSLLYGSSAREAYWRLVFEVKLIQDSLKLEVTTQKKTRLASQKLSEVGWNTVNVSREVVSEGTTALSQPKPIKRPVFSDGPEYSDISNIRPSGNSVFDGFLKLEKEIGEYVKSSLGTTRSPNASDFKDQP